MSNDINSFSAIELAHKFIAENVSEGDRCIDATAGRGNDTAFLCELVGESGHVTAFDIQKDAIDSTAALLASKGLSERATLVLGSHSGMDEYAEAGSIACVVFNFGWLPGGDHNINTRAQTSLEAVGKALELLRPDGIISISIYYGRNTGFEERDALLEYFRQIDSRRFTVLVGDFANRGGCPPIPVFIWKGR